MEEHQACIVTGAAGFIGSHFAELAVKHFDRVIALDNLSFGGSMLNLENLTGNDRFEFHKGSIEDGEKFSQLLKTHQPLAVFNFAAESHVDRSITSPESFLRTNINGVFQLLHSCRVFFEGLGNEEKKNFRFVQISTDEVFGDFPIDSKEAFNENSPYRPSSPYSASKAAADHLCHSWFRTYGLPTMVTNCSNNFGPRQFPEKLIPRIIDRSLQEKKLPVFAQGLNVRDWIHVKDHCQGVFLAFQKGRIGESYCFGSNSEKRNIDLVKTICSILDQKRPRTQGSYADLIEFVDDRPGHDRRYAIDFSKAKEELGYLPESHADSAIEETVVWYLENTKWLEALKLEKGFQ